MAFGALPPLPSGSRCRNVIYRSVFRLFGWPNFLRRLQWPMFKSFIGDDAGTTVLDLGAGPMQYSVELAKQYAAHVIACDTDPPMGCSEWAQRNGISVLKADAQALPLRDHSVDRIVMSSLLQMVPFPDHLLAECRRVLKADGFMIMSVPNHYQLIPALFTQRWGRAILKLLGLPRSETEFVGSLNRKFRVGGSQGYYSLRELTELVERAGCQIVAHRHSPGRMGSFLWEIGVLLHQRLGNLAFHLLLLFYPLARLYDKLSRSSTGCEHLVKVAPAP